MIHKTSSYMGKIKRMDQVKTIIATYLDCGSIKSTARRLKISKNTVKDYLRRAEAHNVELSALLLLSQSELLKIFYKPKNAAASSKESVFNEKVDDWLKELRRVGVTKYLLWEEYREEHSDGYGYSQFCRRLRQATGRRDLTLSMEHTPGEVMQVDFAGKRMSWVDSQTGEVHYVQVLVVVMPHSQYTFAIALNSQKVGNFIHGLNQSLLFLGRLPKIILSDNLKAFVTQSDRYEPKFNELAGQLGAHYGIDLQAARPRKPKDKASVENMVSTVYRRIYAPLRDEIFHSIDELNEAIRGRLKIHNETPFQKKEGTRRSVFESAELPLMRDLPTDLFEIKKMTRAKVQRNYHVFLGEEKNYYSVPFKYVGKQTTVVYTTSIVEIYLENKRIALHKRLLGKNSYLHRTEDTHMPKSHLEWKKSKGYDAAYFSAKAAKIGEATQWSIGQILISKPYQSQTYNSCRGVLHLAKIYTPERLEAAADRCRKAGKVTYSMLKRILIGKLDMHTDTPELGFEPANDFSTPPHDNIRGPAAYS